jgi:hypothetical protein
MRKISLIWILCLLLATAAQALQLDPQPGESLLESVQEGKYLALTYKSQGFSATNIRAVDLETGSIIYQGQQLYPESNLIHPTIFEHFLLYMIRDEIIRLDLETGQEQSRSGRIRAITSDGTLVTGDEMVDIAGWTVTGEYDDEFYTPRFALEDQIICSVKDVERRNPAGYQALSGNGEVLWTLAAASPIQVHLPSEGHSIIRSFPLPLFRYDEDGRWHVDFLDRTGEIIRSHPLTDLGIDVALEEERQKNWLHNFTVMDDRAGRKTISCRLFTETGGDDPVRHALLAGASGGIDTVLTFPGKYTAGIDPQGQAIFISEEPPGQDQCYVSVYGPGGKPVSRAPLTEWFDRPTEFRILDSGEILAEADGNLFLKCSAQTGQATGLYAYPSDDRVELAGIYGNSAYLFATPRFKTSPTLDQGTRLLSFSAEEAGWFEIELVTVEPNTGSMDEVYADSDVLLQFQADRSLEKMITVQFEAGQASRRSGSGLRYDWHTPDEERTVRITASLGPLTRTFDIAVTKVLDALTLELTARTPDAHRLTISGEVANGTNLDIDGLNWEVTTKNLSITSSSLPEKVQAHRDRGVAVRTELILPDDLATRWDGYQIAGSATVRLQTDTQQFEKTFQTRLEIEPTRSFFIRFQNRETERSIHPRDIALEQLKIYDQDGTEITSSLVITKVGSKVNVGGLAPGLASRPVKLTAAYLDARAEVKLAFRDIRSTERFSPPTVILKVLSEPLLTVTTLVGGEPQRGIQADLYREDEEECCYKSFTGRNGSRTFSELETGRYTVRLYEEGYIPQELTVNLDRPIHYHETVEMQRYVAVLLKGKAYYESAFTDVIGAEVLKSYHLTEASDHIFILPPWAQEVHFNMLYKVGCPEGLLTDLFEESDYSIDYEVTRVSDSGFSTRLVGEESFSRSDGYEERKEEDIYVDPDQLGFSYPADKITRPTRFDIEVVALNKDYDIVVWIFPGNWETYSTEARQVALLYGLKGNLDMLDYGENAKEYLNSRGDVSNLIASGLSPIIDYGSESLAIFGDVPDGTLGGFISDRAESFAEKLVEKVLENLVGTVATGIFGEIYAILGSIKKAIDWGDQMPEVIEAGTDAVYANSLLEGIAEEDVNFLQALAFFETLRSTMEAFIAAVDGNDPALCRTHLNRIEVICVGHHPDSDRPADYQIDYAEYGVNDAGGGGYPLAVTLALEYSRVDEWASGDGIAPYFDDDPVSIPPDDKMSATEEATKTYGPIWETMFRIAAVFIDASLLDE